MSVKARYYLIFFVVFSVVYLFRFQAKLKTNFNDGDNLKITTKLSQEPILKGNYQTFKIKNINIKTDRFPKYQYGESLIISGTLKSQVINSKFSKFWLINPTIAKVKADSIEGKVGLKNYLLASLFKFRSKLESVISQVLPEPQASLLIGILLGIQRSMSNSFYQDLQTTGTLHIIVASGMNITLIAGSIKELLFRFIGRKPALLMGLFAVVFYCLLAGLNPPIVRAGIMASILYLANFLGREGTGFWILLLTAAIMLIISPLIIFDVGFQLSFTATAGLILISPLLQKKFNFASFLKDDLTETTSALIFTFPVLVVTFGRFNPFSIIPNSLVLFLIPSLMILGMLISLSGLLFMGLAQFFGWLAWLPLTYFIKVINFFGQFDFLYFKLEGFSWVFGLGYYLLIFSFLVRKPKKRKINH
ncbi:ComEC/Rec2 family competence protein [Patescibacteria group bacterium]